MSRRTTRSWRRLWSGGDVRASSRKPRSGYPATVLSMFELGAIAENGVCDEHELSGDGDQGDLGGFAGFAQAFVEGLQARIAACCCDSRHVERIADALATSLDLAGAPELAAVDVEGREAGESRDLLARQG